MNAQKSKWALITLSMHHLDVTLSWIDNECTRLLEKQGLKAETNLKTVVESLKYQDKNICILQFKNCPSGV